MKMFNMHDALSLEVVNGMHRLISESLDVLQVVSFGFIIGSGIMESKDGFHFRVRNLHFIVCFYIHCQEYCSLLAAQNRGGLHRCTEEEGVSKKKVTGGFVGLNRAPG